MTELRKGYRKEPGSHGSGLLEASQPDIAAQGRFTLVRLEGNPVYNSVYDATAPGRTRWADQSVQREAQFGLLRSVANILDPYYGFIIDDNDVEVMHNGDIPKFPPLEPWTYFWHLMVYGRQLQQILGRNRLLETPAERVIESDASLIWLQPYDYVFYKVGEELSDTFYKAEIEARRKRLGDVLDYLRLKIPAPTLF